LTKIHYLHICDNNIQTSHLDNLPDCLTKLDHKIKLNQTKYNNNTRNNVTYQIVKQY
jgi:hypothetical protein